MTRRGAAFVLLAAADLALVVYAALGPALVAALLMARYLGVAVLVAFGVVLGPFLSFGGTGGDSLPPPWQLDLGPPEPLAMALVAGCLRSVGVALCLLESRHSARRGRLAIICSAVGFAMAYGGSWLR